MEAGLTLSRAARLTHTLQSPWEIASQWVGPREVYPEETPELAAVLTSLSTARIERADVGYKGTQLKALLVLDGGQKVVFKPKRCVVVVVFAVTWQPSSFSQKGYNFQLTPVQVNAKRITFDYFLTGSHSICMIAVLQYFPLPRLPPSLS